MTATSSGRPAAAERSVAGLGRTRPAGLAPALALLLVGHATPGGAEGYVDRAAFLAALPGTAETVDFDGVASGTAVASGGVVGGVAFHYDYGGVLLEVTGAYPARSGANALGSTDAHVLQDGDNLDLAFAPRNALGLSIVTKEALEDGDLTLSAGGERVGIRAPAVEQVLADGSRVYFLGVVDPDVAFTGATLLTAGGGWFFYNLDDVVLAAAADADADGIADGADNCVLAANGPLLPDAGGNSQLDTNGDGYGNRCDGDINDNGAVNAADLALFRLAFGSNGASANWNPHADFNGSGSVNAADLAIFRTLFGKAPGPSGAP